MLNPYIRRKTCRSVDPFHKLDNPAWNALNDKHSAFVLGNEHIKLYDPHYAPFGGIIPETDSSALIASYFPDTDFYYIIGNEPLVPNGFLLESELVCLQMVCEKKIGIEITQPITHLSQDHQQALFEIVNLVQPGYFRPRTSLMGEYFGIFQENRLVAVTGERMRMHELTEISAVVTHPAFTGRGYAQQLVTHTVNKNLSEGLLTFLHVRDDNAHAIRLYEKIGFRARRRISFWKIKKL